MLARNWKRIGLIILIVACFANITSKLVQRVSFNDNVKSTVTNVVEKVDDTIKNAVNGDEKKQPTQTNTPRPQNTQTQVQNQTVPPTTNTVTQQNTFVIEEVTNTVN